MMPPPRAMPARRVPAALGGDEQAVSQVVGFTFAGVIFMGLVATLFMTAADPGEAPGNPDLSEGPWRAQAEVVLDALLAEGGQAWQLGEDGRTLRAADVAAYAASPTAHDDMVAALDLPDGTSVRIEVTQATDAGEAACPGTVALGSNEPNATSGQAVAYRTWDALATVQATDDDGGAHTWTMGTAACADQVEVRVHVWV